MQRQVNKSRHTKIVEVKHKGGYKKGSSPFMQVNGVFQLHIFRSLCAYKFTIVTGIAKT